MKRVRIILAAVAVLILIAAAVGFYFIRTNTNLTAVRGGGDETAVSLPEGFASNVFSSGLNGPRFIAFDDAGVLHVADRQSGRILALPDADGDGVADQQRVFAADLGSPHSLVFHEGAWFVGVPSGVIRLADTTGDGVADQREVIIDDIPTSGSHTTRTVEFLPDGRMVLSVGSTCNVCEEDDPRRATVVVYDSPSGGGETLFATGLRNAVGLAIHPATGELWASNNGRDLLGDDFPPETIYRVSEGADYGWPTCINGHTPDPDMGFDGACTGVSSPVTEMQAHSAPMALLFYPENATGAAAFPPDYQGDLFIAFRGSWNRTEPTGYKVVRLPLDGSEPTGEVIDFATGWLNEDETSDGRPVGLAVGPDGALYVSDDKGGFIYRIAYQN